MTPIGFQIYNRHGTELFGSEEDTALNVDLPPGTPTYPHPPCRSPITQFSQSNGPIAEMDIDGPLSLSNMLFREEQDNNMNLLPNSEEHP